MFRLTAQLCASAELVLAGVAITVDNPDTWLALAPAQPAQALSQEPDVDLVLHVEVSVVDLFLVVDLLADHALLLATSAEDQTILPETARLRP